MSTLQQIRAEVQLFLTETDSNGHFTPTQLNGFINMGIDKTAIISEKSEDSFEFTLEDGAGQYQLPSDNVLIQQAYLGDKNTLNDLKPIVIYTKETIKAINPFWLNEHNDSKGEPKHLILLDNGTIYLDPRPDAATVAASKKLIVFYVFKPTDLSQDSQTPNIPLAYHSLIKFYALYLCYMALKNAAMADKYKSDWMSEYNMIKQAVERGATETNRFSFNFREDY